MRWHPCHWVRCPRGHVAGLPWKVLLGTHQAHRATQTCPAASPPTAPSKIAVPNSALGAEPSWTVLAMARPSPLFPWAPPSLEACALGWGAGQGDGPRRCFPAAQQEAQCWEMGLRGPRGGRANLQAEGVSVKQSPRESPKGRPPVLRVSRLSGQLPQDWREATSPLRGSSVMLESISLAVTGSSPCARRDPAAAAEPGRSS